MQKSDAVSKILRFVPVSGKNYIRVRMQYLWKFVWKFGAFAMLIVMMPKLDGIRATFQARKTSSIPIIILSAKTEDADKILGLNVGADDYVTKPFNPL